MYRSGVTPEKTCTDLGSRLRRLVLGPGGCCQTQFEEILRLTTYAHSQEETASFSLLHFSTVGTSSWLVDPQLHSGMVFKG